MKKDQPSRITPKKNSINNSLKEESNDEKTNLTMEAITKEWKNGLASLSYEDSLKALDTLLEDLQNDTVPVEELQKHYLRANLYLDHCEDLLQNIEQEVIHLKPEDLK